jgi:hypothetical protein
MVEKAEKPALDTLSGSGQTQPAGSDYRLADPGAVHSGRSLSGVPL